MTDPIGSPANTRLLIPQPRPLRVARPHLLERLTQGFAQGARLALVSAPAGFGKTTLISAWLADYETPAAWLTLDSAESLPARLLQMLVEAMRTRLPGFGQALLDLLNNPQGLAPEALSLALASNLAAIDAPLVFVLDDLHHVQGRSAQALLAAWIDSMPPGLPLVLITREDPPLPLARMRARGELIEIRERDLRFAPAESDRFLREVMGLAPDPETESALYNRTEGWAAGLQLAALALKEGRQDSRQFVEAFAGSDRYITDYLVEEVINRLDADLRDFLCRTAVLNRMNAALCTELTGREDSQALLESLETANLFVSALDNRRQWYRYHPLFADVLVESLDSAERASLHARAARWFEAQGQPAEAIEQERQAASLSGDYTALDALVREAASEALQAGHFQLLQGWLLAFPEAYLRSRPALCAYRAMTALAEGRLDATWEYLRIAQGADEAAAGLAPGTFASLEAVLLMMVRGDIEGAIGRARVALDLLPPEESFWRLMVLWALAEAQERSRPLEEAIDTLREAARLASARGARLNLILIVNSLSLDLYLNGNLSEGLTLIDHTLSALGISSDSEDMAASLLLHRRASLLLERHDLPAAEEASALGHALDLRFGLPRLALYGYQVKARVLAARGDLAAAAASLETAHALPGLDDDEKQLLRASEALLDLQAGRISRLRAYRERLPRPTPPALRFILLDAYLMAARACVALGDSEEAEAWLNALESLCEPRGHRRGLITIYALRALLAAEEGDRVALRACLGQAIQLAAPEGYFDALLCEGPDLLTLLPLAREHAPDFVRAALEAGGLAAVTWAASAQPLDEPLSQRELEVLSLIAAGSSNKEIAARLVISPGTVKRHINNLYGKLGVASRTQALRRARALHLIAQE